MLENTVFLTEFSCPNNNKRSSAIKERKIKDFVCTKPDPLDHKSSNYNDGILINSLNYLAGVK